MLVGCKHRRHVYRLCCRRKASEHTEPEIKAEMHEDDKREIIGKEMRKKNKKKRERMGKEMRKSFSVCRC